MSVPKKILVPTAVALVTGVLVGAILPLGLTDPNPPPPPPGVGAVDPTQPGGGAAGANPANCGLSGANLSAANTSFSQALQDYRKGLGSAVTMDDNLGNLAKQDAEMMATTGPESANTVVGGQTLMQRIRNCSALQKTTAASEIVLNGCFGSTTADGVMQNLQADATAKAILDDPTWDSVGISVVSTPADGVYWIVIFAKEQ